MGPPTRAHRGTDNRSEGRERPPARPSLDGRDLESGDPGLRVDVAELPRARNSVRDLFIWAFYFCPSVSGISRGRPQLNAELRDVSIRPMTAVNTFLQVDLADVDGFTREFLEELQFGQGVTLARATTNDLYMALARTVRQQLMSRWLDTVSTQMRAQAKVVAYLSAEYLLGRQQRVVQLAADLTETAERSMRSLGLDLDRLRDAEVEPGLGNGGLGRLAACFIDSLATMSVPCIGYGIRYEYGIFRQTFVDGRQVEQPDTWLSLGGPWEFPHPESAVQVDFGGQTETYDDMGTPRTRWVPAWNVLGIPYNYMVPGYQNGRVNTLRLWSAQATKAFDLEIFNAGDYAEAVRAQTFAENITKVLYPEDSTPQGKELRLQQQ